MNRPAARRVFDRGADRLMVEAELGRDGPELPALAVEQAPDLGALRGRDHRSSLCGSGPLGAREGAGDIAAGRIERSARPLPVAGAGLDQAAQRLVCGAAPRAVLDGHLIARQADRAVDVADGTGPASSRTPYPAAEQAGPQVFRAPVAAALSSPPPDPLPGLAAALRGLTHETASSSNDQVPDRRRGRGFATGIHLNEALEWSKRPGPPQTPRCRRSAARSR